jgi:hypothetical protein
MLIKNPKNLLELLYGAVPIGFFKNRADAQKKVKELVDAEGKDKSNFKLYRDGMKINL